jgi:hypothetical protein
MEVEFEQVFNEIEVLDEFDSELLCNIIYDRKL